MFAERLSSLGLPYATSLLQAAPPYERLVTWSPADSDPALGTIAAAPASSGVGGLALLKRASLVWPWLMPVCCVEPEISWAVAALWEREGRVAVVRGPALAGRALLQVPKLVAAIDARPWPGPTQLAEYVGARTGQADLAGAVFDQAERVFVPGNRASRISAATYSRLFHRLGDYSARDWRALVGVMIHLQAVRKDSVPPVRIGLSRVTLERRARRYLNRSLRACLALAGWEWILEEHLRSGRYVRA